MKDSLIKYQAEVVDFLNEDTLKAIDYGVLDLSKVKNIELKRVLMYIEDILTIELELNYLNNSTGIFRVSRTRECWCYRENNQVIKADSLLELKERVLRQHRIWYVFDELLVKHSLGGK